MIHRNQSLWGGKIYLVLCIVANYSTWKVFVNVFSVTIN